MEELKKEEQAKKKKKEPIFNIKKEKRLSYYSGWNKNDKPVDKTNIEIQKKLC